MCKKINFHKNKSLLILIMHVKHHKPHGLGVKIISTLFVLFSCITPSRAAENPLNQQTQWHHMLKSAVAGDSAAQLQVGKSYLFGNGVSKDEDAGVEWLTKAATKGNMHAQELLGEHYLLDDYNPDYLLARDWIYNAIERGSAYAKADLGYMYEYGLGVEINTQLAFDLYQAAAEKGAINGQLRLARMLVAKKEYQQAAKLLQVLAGAGYTSAQNGLGVLYLNGWGIKENVHEANALFKLAAEQGMAAAQTNLAESYYFGRGITTDTKEAYRLYQLGAEGGDPHAQQILGWMYSSGRGVKTDLQLAFKWYAMAAAQNDLKAQASIGEAYFYGHGVPVNPELALKWLKKAGVKGQANAQEFLGVAYRDGYASIKTNKIIAYAWFDLAFRKGQQSAARSRADLAHSMTMAEQDTAYQLASQWKAGMDLADIYSE